MLSNLKHSHREIIEDRHGMRCNLKEAMEEDDESGIYVYREMKKLG